MLSNLFLIIQLGFVVFLLFTCIAFVIGAPFVRTNIKSTLVMIQLAGITKGTTVYDLGSGDGRLLRMASNHGAKAIGFEINPMLVLWANLISFGKGKTLWKNFWHIDLKEADVILLYLLPTHMEKLKKKIFAECKKGTIVVSNSFIFPDWKIQHEDRASHIYVFRV